MWVQELGFLNTAMHESLPGDPSKLTTIDSVYGKVSFLAPPLTFRNLTLADASGLSPYNQQVGLRFFTSAILPRR